MQTFSDDNPPALAALLTGFILALLLTLLAFGLAIDEMAVYSGIFKNIPLILHSFGNALGTMQHRLIIASVIFLAILQMLVHLYYFLHLSFRSLLNMQLQATLFAFFIIFIMLTGTLWIMDDLNSNMLHHQVFPQVK